MMFDSILNHFQNVKQEGNQYRVNCPACGDTKRHLYISNANDKVLLDCKKGCNFSDIVYSAGLKKQDLFLNNKPSAPKWTLLREHIYTNENGETLGKKQI